MDREIIAESQVMAASGIGGEDYLSSRSSDEGKGGDEGNQYDAIKNLDTTWKKDRIINNNHSSEGMHGFSSRNEFEINKQCSYYMDRSPITSSNRQAVEFVYMIEVETLCQEENTMKKPELMEKVFQLKCL